MSFIDIHHLTLSLVETPCTQFIQNIFKERAKEFILRFNCHAHKSIHNVKANKSIDHMIVYVVCVYGRPLRSNFR